MRFFEVDSAVDAIMSAAMLAQTKAGSRNQQGQLSMNGFLQMLKNAGVVMDYEGFKTVYDTNPQLANVIAKFDKDTVTFMSADGDNKAVDNTKPSNQPSPDERITQMARSAVRTREHIEINEGAIDTLKKIVTNKQNMPVKFQDGTMKVDLFTASAITKVYDAVNDANKAKLERMLQTKAGMMKVQNFAMGQVKMEDKAVGESGVLYKGGVRKYGKEGMTKIQSAAGSGASAEEIGKIKDKYNKKKKVTADINEQEPADYEKVKARQMQSQLRMFIRDIATLNEKINEISDMDNGDLTDQLATMYKHIQGLYAVASRAQKIVPVYEGISEAIPTSEFGYDIKKFFAKVKELEDENQHGKVAKMVTQLYGTGPELMIINGINAMHSNEGSIGPEAQKLRDKISTKYYYQAEKDANRRNPADSDGPDEEQRDRTRAANTDEGFASDAQRKAAFASGYKPTGKKKKTETKTKNIDFGRMISGKGPKPKDVKTESMQSKFRNFLKGKK